MLTPDVPSPPSPSLPSDIVQGIAISNAESLGEQPAILANLALANQIFNQNLQQQMALANQQATNLLLLATVAKCVGMITGAGSSQFDPATLKELLEMLKQLPSVPTPAAPPAKS